MSEWQVGAGMDGKAPEGANTTEDEPEPENADDYEDDDFEPHEFQVADGQSICATCDDYYDEGNHTN